MNQEVLCLNKLLKMFKEFPFKIHQIKNKNNRLCKNKS